MAKEVVVEASGTRHLGGVEAQVFWAPETGTPILRSVRLDSAATLADAVEASGLDALLPDESWRQPGGALRLAVYGKLKPANARLQPGDRVDITRALKVDPKAARRQRAVRSKMERNLDRRHGKAG